MNNTSVRLLLLPAVLIRRRPFIFQDMKLPGNTTSLLATGVVGIVEFLFTIPAVLWVDQIGRKKILIAGATGANPFDPLAVAPTLTLYLSDLGMAICHFIVAGIIGSYQNTFEEHRAAGWVAIVFIWIFVINFAYSWGMYITKPLRKPITYHFPRSRCLDCY